jgi:hypothetical protein
MMVPDAEAPPLDGIVEVDAVATGGDPKQTNIRRFGAVGRLIYNPSGRGSGKQVNLVAVERHKPIHGPPLPPGPPLPGGRKRAEGQPVKPGRVRSKRIESFTAVEARSVMTKLISPKAVIHSDADPSFKAAVKPAGEAPAAFAGHETVVHSKHEYARGDVHANTVEGLNGIRMRAYLGVWHYWSPEHQHRYDAELDFRAGQREAIQRIRVVRGTPKLRLVSQPRPFIEQLKDMFAGAVGREARRTGDGGIRNVLRGEPTAENGPSPNGAPVAGAAAKPKPIAPTPAPHPDPGFDTDWDFLDNF